MLLARVFQFVYDIKAVFLVGSQPKAAILPPQCNKHNNAGFVFSSRSMANRQAIKELKSFSQMLGFAPATSSDVLLEIEQFK